MSREKKVVVAARLRPSLESVLKREASKRGVAYSSIIESALEKELYGVIDKAKAVDLELLRSVIVVRELLMDMSPRSSEEKDKLWEAITKAAEGLMGQQKASPEAA